MGDGPYDVPRGVQPSCPYATSTSRSSAEVRRADGGALCGRNRERAVLLEARPGGQLLNTELIEDYPGYLSILGGELATVMEEQAAHFGTELVRTEVKGDSRCRAMA